jgi:hypothetical protein
MQRLFLFLFTIAPCLFAQSVTSTVYLSHIADGGSWKTAFTIVNLSGNMGQATLRFHNDDGTLMPLVLTTSNAQSVMSTSITIPPHAVQTFETMGTSAKTVTGWAEFVVDLSTTPLSISAVFQRHIDQRTDYEASVFSATGADRSLIFPFDNTAGFQTGIAAVNGSMLISSMVAVTIRDAMGNILMTDSIPFLPGQHTSFVLSAKYPMTAGQLGTIEFDPDPSGGILSALALRFNPTGAFTTTQALTRQ